MSRKNPPLRLVRGNEPERKAAREPFARWVLTLQEPLISSKARAQVDHDLQVAIERRPSWAAYFFAGFCHDIIHTLPRPDPWRRLAATLNLGDQVFNRDSSGGVAAPKHDGAVLPDGQAFSDYVAAGDLCEPELGVDTTLDMGLVALAEDINPVAAAILAFAGGEPAMLASVLELLYHRLWLEWAAGNGECSAGESFSDHVTSAVRWAVHRRRIYTGADDPFVVVAGFAWLAKADRLDEGGSFANELGLTEGAHIDDEAYAQLSEF